jgi:hypothetical protein
VSGRTIVTDVANEAHADANLLRLGDGCLGRHHRWYIAKKPVAIDDRGCGYLVHDSDIWRRIELAVAKLAAITRCPGNTVAAHTSQI